MRIDLMTIVVNDYDEAIRFYVDVLGFETIEDSASLTNDGRAKRWVVVRPPLAQTGILLAQADGDEQIAVVGHQTGGRVGFFLRVDDFDATLARMVAADVELISAPREEPYGKVVVFCDIAGNRWDLLGPRPSD
jgi:catechol 2,3-dioxygenase-like lactoylglutathione lyase family enzyme